MSIDITFCIDAIENNLFALASKYAYRFEVKGRGKLSVEDLWHLSMDDLSALHSEMQKTAKKNSAGKSLMDMVKDAVASETVDPAVVEDRNKMDIVQAIFLYKAAAKQVAEDASKDRAEKQKIAAALEAKRAKRYENMSEEDLERLLRGDKLPASEAPDVAPAAE